MLNSVSILLSREEHPNIRSEEMMTLSCGKELMRIINIRTISLKLANSM